MKRLIFLTLLAGLSLGVAIAAENPPDVRDLMSANQFHSAGLDARNSEQLTALDAWLASYVHSSPAGSADVRDLMSARQFHATGLDMLNPEQVTAFNAWLATYHAQAAVAASNDGHAQLPVPGVPSSAASLPSAQPDQHATGMLVNTPASPTPTPALPTPAPSAASDTDNFGKTMLTPDARAEPLRIESTIVGRFKGWTGTTVFTLANGQVWRQAASGYFEANLQDPAVVIKRLAIGYLLTLPNEGATVFVVRVR